MSSTKVPDFTFPEGMPAEVQDIIRTYSKNPVARLRFFWGDTTTGRDWMEEHDTIGYIALTTGNHSPMLVNNIRSQGGHVISASIVKVQLGKKVLWQHPNYHLPILLVAPTQGDYANTYPVSVYVNGQIQASFANEQKAQHYIEFMQGLRNKT